MTCTLPKAFVVAKRIADHLSGIGWDIFARPQAGGNSPRGQRQAVAVMELDGSSALCPAGRRHRRLRLRPLDQQGCQKSQMIALLPAGVRGMTSSATLLGESRRLLPRPGRIRPLGKGSRRQTQHLAGLAHAAGHGRVRNAPRAARIPLRRQQDRRRLNPPTVAARLDGLPASKPGAKLASAVIMHGPQGTGKSTIFQTLAKIYGDYSTVLNQRGLEDKFNNDWSDSKLFILAEESSPVPKCGTSKRA